MKSCVNCGRSSDVTPVIDFEYKGQKLGICTSCLPILIHNPQRLAGKIVDAGDLVPGPDHD